MPTLIEHGGQCLPQHGLLQQKTALACELRQIALSKGLETRRGLVERVTERITTVPVAQAQDFTTFKPAKPQWPFMSCKVSVT